MLAIKTFTIFQLIEKSHWVVLAALGVFFLCSSTESALQQISECSAIVSRMYSHDASANINHAVEVCFSLSSPILSSTFCNIHQWIIFQTQSRHCSRSKSSTWRLSFKANHWYSPVDISTSIWKWCTRLSVHRSRIWWFYCNSTLSKLKAEMWKKAR